MSNMAKSVFSCCSVAFNCYSESDRDLGVISVALPEINLRPDKPQLADLRLTVYFANLGKAAKAVKRREWQIIEVRVAEEEVNLQTCQMDISALRHIANARPIRLGAGSVRIDESACPFVVYEVSYYKAVRDGETELEIDTAAQICTIGGENFSQAVFRKK